VRVHLPTAAAVGVIFSQDGLGERLSDDDLLVRLLRNYGIHTTRADLEWFAQAFWAQSVDLKCRFGWRPPSASDFPRRVYTRRCRWRWIVRLKNCNR
jgi:hypothetical protein